MKSIRLKIAGSYLIVILITIIISEVFLIAAVQKYYYKNLEETLNNQIKMSSEFYNNYLYFRSVDENISNNVDVFWENTSAKVQVIDLKGNVIMNSVGVLETDIIDSKDYKEALKGKSESLIYSSKSNETLMSISYPLYFNNKVDGVLRFTTSTKQIDSNIQRLAFFFIIAGLGVVMISGIVSFFISNTIAKPIKKITMGAEKMASGNFTYKIKKISNDELGKLTDTLNYMSEEILKNEKLKNEFIASVSHELRTPLTSIKGWSIVLNSDDFSDLDETKEGLQIIEQEADRLTFLVEELLDFSKLLSGKITLNKENFNINDVLLNIIKQLTPKSNQKNIIISLRCEEDLINIHADKNRLKQVFINILDNALKFTEAGGTIDIYIKKINDNISITIKDTGCGISEEELPRIKEKFFKGKGANSKNGIGLSICDEIIKFHNGEFNINSNLGEGTEVEIILPLGTFK